MGTDTPRLQNELRIFQQALNLTADKDVALDYLKKTYERVLRGDDFVDETHESEESAKETAEEPASKA
ncbi:MAG TPA: hypothetical protein VN982_11110 [Candidatus Dormibacteraeota bacterium]|nr:hypothetical protein [Candidatus Dormibacteraeota bacterium]